MSDPEQEGTPGPEMGTEALTPTLTRFPGPREQDKPPAFEPGHTLAGRYTVLNVLGAGGMGVVLAVYDARLDRRVALKLLRSKDSGAPQEAETRLVREAQAMARLSHPNVVAVYDAGTLDNGEVFVAMEYVEGETLRQWRQHGRSWQEVLSAYVAAGRGLAAAHAANIVHRDFKPDNVLVGKEGRVRVMDFGLARSEYAPEPSPAPAPEPPPPELPLTAETVGSPLTQPGMLMGTPAYMAPEVLRGRPADARSDIYSFSVSLYEALYGEVPYAGKTLAALLKAQEEGQVKPAPSPTEVPEWVRRTVLRGLEASPTRRPSSMEELLQELETGPGEKRRALRQKGSWVIGAGLLLMLAAMGWVRQQEAGCSQQERRLAGVWDEAVRAKVKQAIEGTGIPGAEDTFGRVSAVLDEYAGLWVKQRREVCEALKGQVMEPRSLAVRQEYCLERRRGQMRALTELLARGPDPELVPRAVRLTQGLPPLEYCADAQALAAAVPPPEDKALRAQVEALQKPVDQMEALYLAGKYTEGLALAEQLLAQVELVGHVPLRAQLVYLTAKLREGAGDYAGAEKWMRQAISLAARGKDLSLLARAWSQLLTLVGTRQGRLQEAEQLELAVEAAVELSEDDRARAAALYSLGTMLRRAGRFEEARDKCERALALDERTRTAGRSFVAASLTCLGNALEELGRYEEALEKYERALALDEQLLSAEHPYKANSINNLGNALANLGRYEEAREQHERALRMREKVLGPDHPDVAGSLEGLGRVALEQGRQEEARARYELALTVRERKQGSRHPELAVALLGLARLRQVQGRPAEALPLLERALALDAKRLQADLRFELAQALWSANQDRPRAVELAGKAHEYWRGLGHKPKLAQASQWLASHATP